MVSVLIIRTPTAYVILDFKTLAPYLWTGRNGTPGPIGKLQDAGHTCVAECDVVTAPLCSFQQQPIQAPLVTLKLWLMIYHS